MQNDQKLRQIRITLFKMVTFPSLLSQQHLSMALCYVQFPCVLLGGNLIFLHRMEAPFNRSLEKLFLHKNSADIW